MLRRYCQSGFELSQSTLCSGKGFPFCLHPPGGSPGPLREHTHHGLHRAPGIYNWDHAPCDSDGRGSEGEGGGARLLCPGGRDIHFNHNPDLAVLKIYFTSP